MSNTKKMTVKEAYNLLDYASGEIYDQVFYDYNPYEFDEQDYEAFCMAVDALKEKCGSNDLISRKAAIDALCNDYCGGHQDCKYYPKCENLKSIQQLPSAQPKIVRCKDCKHSDFYNQCNHVTWWNSKDDFCSRAERRTDE